MFGLEEGVITPENSFIAWNGETYPFEAWNADQTLQSAMNSSVNWYFQAVDEQLGVYQQEANIALQYTVAIRDKALEAYNSIMNMSM